MSKTIHVRRYQRLDLHRRRTDSISPMTVVLSVQLRLKLSELVCAAQSKVKTQDMSIKIGGVEQGKDVPPNNLKGQERPQNKGCMV